MVQIQKTKKVKKRKDTPMARLFKTIAIGLFIGGLVAIFPVILNTIHLQNQLNIAKKELSSLQEENQQLTEQRLKLEDDDYIKSYARSTYNLSKQGEQIFYLPEDSSK